MTQLTPAQAQFIIAHASIASVSDLLIALDTLAPTRVCCFQFIDDSFTLQSTVAGVNEACKAADTFCQLWRHRFAGGSKGPTLMPVSCALAGDCFTETLCGSRPQLVDSMKILGSVFDKHLTFELALNVACAKLLDQTRLLSNQVRQLGLGTSVLIDELHSRVFPSALFGIEVVASCSLGWKAVQVKLNQTHYMLAKEMLGVPCLRLGKGGHARLFQELGIKMRLGTRVAVRIALCRARALSMSPGLLAAAPFAVALQHQGKNWLHQAEVISSVCLGIQQDYLDSGPWLQILREGKENSAKLAVQSWKKHVVLPAAWRLETSWFMTQLQVRGPQGSLPRATPAFAQIVPRLVWNEGLCRCLRAWIVARLTGGIPLAIWCFWMGVPEALDICPACSVESVRLSHFVDACPAFTALRCGSGCSASLLQDTDSEEELQQKVQSLGRVVRLLVRWRLG